MKQLRNLTLSALAFITIGAVTLVSCNPDACKDVICENGGICSDGTCDCASGYEGTDCSTLSASKFLGTNNGTASYSFADNGGTACGNYTGTFTVALSSTDDTKLIFTNLGGFGASTTVYGTVDGSTLTIPSQQIAGATSNTIQGNGTYSNGVITGSYTNNDGVTSCTYSFTWTKQ